MSSADVAVAQLRTDEGFRATPYKDSVGKLTVGYGINLDAGISEAEAALMLAYRVRQIEQRMMGFQWYSALNDARRAVILNVAYNVGVDGLLHFPKMIGALLAQNWTAASQELLNSDAARMNVARYQRLANTLLSGGA